MLEICVIASKFSLYFIHFQIILIEIYSIYDSHDSCKYMVGLECAISEKMVYHLTSVKPLMESMLSYQQLDP